MLLNCGVGEDSWEALGLKGDQTSLKEISPKYSLKGLMLKLKLQYFGYLIRRTDSLEKTLVLGFIFFFHGTWLSDWTKLNWKGSREGSMFLSFPASKEAHIPWLMAPSAINKAYHSNLCFHGHTISFCLCHHIAFTVYDTSICLLKGPLWFHWAHPR